MSDVEDPVSPAVSLDKRAIAFVAIASLIFKLLLALRTYGTNDVYAYERFYVWSSALGVHIYKAAWDFNHPPSMIHILSLIGWTAHVTGIPFAFWLRLPGILADTGSIWLVWKLLRHRMIAHRSTRLALLFLAAAPVSIMVSGFHGNDDGVLIFFVLLSVWLTEKGTSAWIAGAVFGISMCFKISPVIVAPAMILYQPDIRRRLEFIGGMIGLLIIAWQPYLSQDPLQIWHSVFGYQSRPGIWGSTYLTDQLAAWSPSLGWIDRFFINHGAWFVLIVCAVAAVAMDRLPKKPSLYAQVGLIFFLFMSLSSGFGVQYLVWLAPWVVELGIVPSAIFFLTSGLFLFSVYDFWCQGLPWYLADSNRIGPWFGYMEAFQLLTWASVLFLTWSAGGRILRLQRGMQNEDADSMPSANFWIIFGASAVSLTFFAATQWIPLQQTGRTARAAMGPASIVAIRAQIDQGLADITAAQQALRFRGDPGSARQLLDLSVRQYQAGQFQDSLHNAALATQIDPSMAEGYNEMAADYNGLHQWDRAIDAAGHALRLKPDLASARDNLVWAARQKMLSRP